jgi:hypothetical protein
LEDIGIIKSANDIIRAMTHPTDPAKRRAFNDLPNGIDEPTEIRAANKRPRLTRPSLGRSIAWLADRHRDPTPINSRRPREMLLPIAGKKPAKEAAAKKIEGAAEVRHRAAPPQQRRDPRRQPRGRVCLKWKPFGVNLLATARTSPSHVSSAIFWASMTSPIGKAPIGMKRNPSCRRPLSSISHTFTEAPAWILYRFPLSLPTTSK